MGDISSSPISLDSHLLLDQPLLRLPYELLRKNFRSAHFTFEKDTTQVTKLLKETATGSVNGKTSPEDVVKNLDTMLARLGGMKRKLASYADEEAKIYEQVDARVSHLQELESIQTVDDVKYDAWSRKRLDRLLIDYLLRHGYSDSASSLAAERGMRDLVDIDTFVAMSKIHDSLRKGKSVTEALAWCADNKKELRKMDSRLEFELRYQQFIELVRSQDQAKLLEAIAHARKHLRPYSATYPKEVMQVCALLAYPPESDGLRTMGDEETTSYGGLYSPKRWDMLAELFTETHNSLLSLPSCPLLHIALSSGLSALKTPACHSRTMTVPPSLPPQPLSAPQPTTTHLQQQEQQQHQQQTSHLNGTATPSTFPPASAALPAMASMASVCPICSTELNALSRSVPYAHHTQSHVEPDLLLLPNSHVYGEVKLDEYARKTGVVAQGSVRDLRTQEVFPRSALKKVYIT